MLSTPLLALCLAYVPTLALAGLFPSDSVVKMLDPKGFKKIMKKNETSMVAFVAPWCGHCQRMSPDYSKAALGLYPLVPAYAVDCDDDKNKRLCAEQGVQGFPTVKLYPRGAEMGSMTYDNPERSASGFFYWASRRIPQTVEKLYKVGDIQPWIEKSANLGKPRALLLTKEKKIPLLWKVLGNRYKGEIEFASHRDRKGKSSVQLGYEAGEKWVAKVLVFPTGETQAVRYEGINKLNSLSKFFDSVLDGTADLTIINKEAASEEYTPSEEDIEIERKQEAQKIALAHGGFADIIDFEEAIKNGAGSDFHDVHGFGSMEDLVKKSKPVEAMTKEQLVPGEIPTVPKTHAEEDEEVPVLEDTVVEQVVLSVPSSTEAAEQCAVSSDECGTSLPHPTDEL